MVGTFRVYHLFTTAPFLDCLEKRVIGWKTNKPRSDPRLAGGQWQVGVSCISGSLAGAVGAISTLGVKVVWVV